MSSAQQLKSTDNVFEEKIADYSKHSNHSASNSSDTNWASCGMSANRLEQCLTSPLDV